MEKHLHNAERLIDFLLPFPGERSWNEIKDYMDIADVDLQLLINKIDSELPGLIYKSVDMQNKLIALGLREEKKPELLHFVEERAF